MVGYIIYGIFIMIVYIIGYGVNGFIFNLVIGIYYFLYLNM